MEVGVETKLWNEGYKRGGKCLWHENDFIC